MKEVYIVISRFKGNNDFTSVGVSQECYTDMEKAIDFCKSRLNTKELEQREKAVKRNLVNWYEYDTKDYHYEIKVLSIA